MRRIWILLVLLGIGTGLAWWWWQQPATPADSPVVGSGLVLAQQAAPMEPPALGNSGKPERRASPAASADVDASAVAAAADSGAASENLPAPGLPLRETAAALLKASRAGSLKASKRLMQELSDCQRQRWASLRMDMMIAFEDSPRGQGRGGDRFREAMSEAAQTVSDLGQQCADLPDDFDEAILFEVQRRAAQAGDLAGQLAFALVPALTLSKSLQQMDRLEIYRELAPQVLEQALQHGSGQAVAGFMDAYEYYFEGWRGRRGEGSAMQTQAMRKMMQAVRPLDPLQQVLGEDLTKAYRYGLLCKRVCNGTDQARAEATLLRLAVSLEPEQRRQAQDDANQLFDDYFAARPRADDIDLDALRDAVLGFRR
jgi:hypothetical protein